MRLRAIHDKHNDWDFCAWSTACTTAPPQSGRTCRCMHASPPRALSRASVRVLVGFGRRRRDIVGERGRVLVNHGRIDAVNLHLALDLRRVVDSTVSGSCELRNENGRRQSAAAALVLQSDSFARSPSEIRNQQCTECRHAHWHTPAGCRRRP